MEYNIIDITHKINNNINDNNNNILNIKCYDLKILLNKFNISID